MESTELSGTLLRAQLRRLFFSFAAHPYLTLLLCCAAFAFSFSYVDYWTLAPTPFFYVLCAALGIAACAWLLLKRQPWQLCIGVCAAVGALCVGAGLFNGSGQFVYFIYALIALCAAAAVYLALKKRLSTPKAIFLILCAAFLLRAAYIVSTAYYIRQHDSYGHTDWGHLGYIWYFFEHDFALPDFDPRTVWQFYHPPLHHFLEALWLKVQSLLGISAYTLFENLQIPTLFYSCCSTVTAYKVFRQLKLKGLPLLIPTAVIALHPTFSLFSGYINNDPLCTLFIFLAVLMTLRWYDEPNMRNILKLAVFIGLGMMTKLSAALIAPAVALVLLWRFAADKRSRRALLGQFAAFGAVCAPLGLWHPLYCLVRFGVPLGFVPSAGVTSNEIPSSVYPFVNRIFITSLDPIRFPFFNTDPKYNYNIPATLLRSSLFSEFQFSETVFGLKLYHLLAVLNCLCALTALVIMLRVLFSKKYDISPCQKLFFACAYAVLMVSYTSFAFKYPSICSMNFRYIAPVLLFTLSFVGVWLKRALKNENRPALVKAYGASALFGAFCAASMLIYIIICLTIVSVAGGI